MDTRPPTKKSHHVEGRIRGWDRKQNLRFSAQSTQHSMSTILKALEDEGGGEGEGGEGNEYYGRKREGRTVFYG